MSNKTIKDVLGTFTEEQKNVLYAMLAMMEDNDSEEMSHGLTEDEFKSMITEAKTEYNGSLKEAFLAHSLDTTGVTGPVEGEADKAYGVKGLDMLFPDDKMDPNGVQTIEEDDEWVEKVFSAVSKTPFSRVKSIFADLSERQIRAKGYIKGELKKEDVVALLKRSTSPQTIYVKQKFDRDDMIDIQDFAAIPWLKAQMRKALKYEIARAILIGDGRSAEDHNKIKEEYIRSIWNDTSLFTVNAVMEVSPDESESAVAQKFIRTMIKNRKFYKGSGNPVLFADENIITDCLLLEDKNGRKIYKDIDELAKTLRCKEIIPVLDMEEATRSVKGTTRKLLGIYGNMKDYRIGADKGYKVDEFNDFDIDFNQYKYLMETRLAGATIKPYSFVVIESQAPAKKVSDPVINPAG